MILLGIAVTPVLLSSSSLGNQLSSSSLISVVLLGGVILTLLSAITISVGEKARLANVWHCEIFVWRKRGHRH